jgi:Zn-dependent M28 family amino/carboxypeptidase
MIRITQSPRTPVPWLSRLAAVVLPLALTISCASLLPRHSRPGADATYAEAATRITTAYLHSVIRFLADDALEGRGPGTRGDRLARLYVATVMEGLGLQPGGPGGQWEQAFELIGVTTSAPQHWRFASRSASLDLDLASDFVVSAPAQVEAPALDGAEVVFAGYAIQAPEYQWDDFKAADLRGTVLLVLNNDPDWDPDLFAGKRRLYYGRWTYKYESAFRQGAAGAIIVHTDESAAYPWQTVQTSWSGENSILLGASAERVPVQAWVTEEAASRVAALGGRDWNELVAAARSRDFRPIRLGVRTSLLLRNSMRRYESANVVGILPGSDPTRRAQAVIYSAHLDHLGVGPAPDGEEVIYNGALDNAAGVAQLLALARAFSALPQAPSRSIVFLAVAAEEQGLLGSEYYTRNPTVLPQQMAANLNMDGGNIWGRTRDVPAVGYGKSELDAFAAAAAARQGRSYVDEQFPERGSFYRSDQFSFARIGVPGLLLRSGTDFVGRPPGWGREQIDAWIANHYHQPSDEHDPSWDLSGMVEDTQFLFHIGVAVAEAAEIPQWHAGDEFAGLR